MKTSERHHLKENEVALAIGRARAWLAAHRRGAGIASALAAGLLVGGGAYAAWTSHLENQARALLASAMVTAEARLVPPAPAADGDAAPQPPGTYPSHRARLEAALPQFLAAADAYPSTAAGRLARFQAAAALVELARADEALAQYDRLVGGRDLVARMARLGRAEALVAAGRFDEAIAALRALADVPDPALPVEGVLLELARAYQLAGRGDEARATLQAILDQHADSPFAASAREALQRMS